MPLKVVQISPAGIFLGYIGRVKGKGITDIGVLSAVIAAQLPAERNHFLFPLLSGNVVRKVEQILQIMYARIPGEVPVTAAQHLQAVGVFSVTDQRVVSAGRRDKIRPVRHSILMQDGKVLIESWNDQSAPPFFLLISIFRFFDFPLLRPAIRLRGSIRQREITAFRQLLTVFGHLPKDVSSAHSRSLFRSSARFPLCTGARHHPEQRPGWYRRIRLRGPCSRHHCRESSL